MIIQCRICQTKYRFDETRIPPDGVWVRCTRCQKVFFQHPPLPPLAVDKPGALRENVLETQIDGNGEGKQLPETRRDRNASLEASKTVDMRNIDEIQGFPELAEDRGHLPEAGPKRIRIWVLSAIMLLLAVGGGSLFLFPEYGRMAIRELNALFPGLVSFTTQEATAPVVGPAQVKIVDVRQRFVNNALLGNIRIVEGVAMNASPYPMARLKVRGELFDAIGTPVRESSAFCGNLLTDEELGLMSEEQIFRELANLQGSDVPNDKIAPNGTIPFMIVFIREPAGVTRTFVIPVAAERLLSS